MDIETVLVIWMSLGLLVSLACLAVVIASQREKTVQRGAVGCCLGCLVGVVPFLLSIGLSTTGMLKQSRADRAEHERLQGQLGALRRYANEKLDWSQLNGWTKAPNPYVRGRILYLKWSRDDADSPVVYEVPDEQLKPPSGIPSDLFAKDIYDVGTVVLTRSEYSSTTWQSELGPWGTHTHTTFMGIRVTLYDVATRKRAGETLLKGNEQDAKWPEPLAWVASLPRKPMPTAR